MKHKYSVSETKTGHFFSTLVIERESRSRNVLSKTNIAIIKEVIEKYGISEENINEISVYRDNKKILINIEYCRINILEMTQGTIEEQIKKVLYQFGFDEKNITKIKNDKEKSLWKVSVKSGYGQKETITAHSDEVLISSEMKKILGINILVSM